MRSQFCPCEIAIALTNFENFMPEPQPNTDRQTISELIVAKFDYQDACEKKYQAEKELLRAKEKASRLIDFESGNTFLIYQIGDKCWLLHSDPEKDVKYTDIFPVPQI